ncbi:MAG: hypothetical protein KKB51_09835 [Candidatus Riflebacteria bacterium]|nr:hypothetical protein [Candidatus Riflebacteria bacterium]
MLRHALLVIQILLLLGSGSDKTCLADENKLAGTLASSTISIGKAFYLPMNFAPFPYQGSFGDSGITFFDSKYSKTGEPAHTNRYGEKIPESRYQDSNVLFYLPPGFSPNKPFFYLVFFHGLPSNPDTEFNNHKLAKQIINSGKNVILIMPPLATNAADASPGKFFAQGAFSSFINETVTSLSSRFPQDTHAQFVNAPIVLAAFSGGYKSAAYIVDRGGLGERLHGLLLFDAMFEDVDKFYNWLKSSHKSVFFFHLFGRSCEHNSQVLLSSLQQNGINYSSSWPKSLRPGNIHFIKVATSHTAIPSKGPPKNPVAKVLMTIPGFNRQGDQNDQ